MLHCGFCSKEFKYESEKKRHEQSHSPQFECKECSKKFSFLSALRRHRKQHERTCSVVCSDCGRNFRDEALLKRHIKYAHKGTFICVKCNAKFNSEPALGSHMKMHKPKLERRFRCSYSDCNKTFNYAHHLKHHELTHTKEKQHFCKVCSKGFIQFHHLKTHLKVHTSESHLQCPVLDCKKTFTTEYSRKRHLASHVSTIDSGISSDSNGDNVQESKKESLCCPTCGQVVTSLEYEMHKDKCIGINEETIDLHINASNNTNLNNNHSEPEPEFRCNILLGRCIVENNKNENCLCAQMKDDSNNDATNKNYESVNVRQELKSWQFISDVPKQSTPCMGCDCSSTRGCNIRHIDTINTLDDIGPQIECTNDGIIKIINTFDIEIPEITKSKNETNTAFKEMSNIIPYNSCKDILGRCIVSGSGTINEECLCAKMAAGDQIDNAQEIDELTPRPITSTI